MAPRTIQDERLSALARRLNLRFSADSQTWLADARQRLGGPRHDELQRRRQQLHSQAAASTGTGPEFEIAFYQFVAADPDVCTVMLEGRLGYYDAVLPAVVARLTSLRPRRILDLGAYSGLTSLYLASCFPDAHVLGIERCEGAVQLAREKKAETGINNVEFTLGDYVAYAPAEAFDVVLSLQSMPTYLLPWLPAESPEFYWRGRLLDTVSPQAVPTLQPLADAMSACVRLTRPGGCVILHERFRGYADAVLFQHLAHRAGLQLKELTTVSWQTANEREGIQQAPLCITEAFNGAHLFDERAFFTVYMPAFEKLDLSSPQLDHGAILTGALAHANFQALPAEKKDLCVSLSYPQLDVHLHLGTVGGQAAYVYTCSTRDQRELKLCRASQAPQLFAPVMQFIRQQQLSGAALSVHPEPDQLSSLVRQLLGKV